MVQVVSSSFAIADPQVDGRRWVTETLGLADGSQQVSMYLADVGTDYQAHLDDMVAVANEAPGAGVTGG